MAVGLAVVAGAGSSTTLVSGGGPAKSDCYAELAAQGITSADVKNNKKISCTDGDACDAGLCGDGICIVKVDLCWNQTNVAGCTPPASLDSIKLKKIGFSPLPPAFEGSSCTGSFTDVIVETKKDGTKPGKTNFKTIAKGPKGTKPRTDADAYQVICLPRTDACASPSGAFVD
jgi:hypothetical protein